MNYRAGPNMPMTRPSTIVTVPKPGQVNLAVMQQVQGGNKMTLMQGPPGTQKMMTTGPHGTMQTQVPFMSVLPNLFCSKDPFTNIRQTQECAIHFQIMRTLVMRTFIYLVCSVTIQQQLN